MIVVSIHMAVGIMPASIPEMGAHSLWPGLQSGYYHTVGSLTPKCLSGFFNVLDMRESLVLRGKVTV